MRKLKVMKSFKTDLKKLNKIQIADTNEIVTRLQNDIPLEDKNHDHELTGNYLGYRECHIHPDLLLVYKKTEETNELILVLFRISSHSNIFSVKKSQKK